jgi:hypothetical protein
MVFGWFLLIVWGRCVGALLFRISSINMRHYVALLNKGKDQNDARIRELLRPEGEGLTGEGHRLP